MDIKKIASNVHFYGLVAVTTIASCAFMYDRFAPKPEMIDRHKLLDLHLSTQNGVLLVTSSNDLDIEVDEEHKKLILNVKVGGYEIKSDENFFIENKTDTLRIGFQEAFATEVRNVLDFEKKDPLYLDTVQYAFPLLEKTGPYLK